jgi:hypothetical protein
LFSRRTLSPLSHKEILHLVTTLAYEASLTPIQLQNLWDLFVMGDNVDRIGLLLGLLNLLFNDGKYTKRRDDIIGELSVVDA